LSRSVKYPDRNYLQKQHQSYGGIGELKIKFLKKTEIHVIPAVLMKIDKNRWAILTTSPKIFSEEKSEESFSVFLEEATFINSGSLNNFKDLQDKTDHGNESGKLTT